MAQGALAKAVGVSVSAVKRLGRDVTSPRADTVERIRKALAAEGVEFVFGSGGEVQGIMVRPKPPAKASEAPTRGRGGRGKSKQVGRGKPE